MPKPFNATLLAVAAGFMVCATPARAQFPNFLGALKGVAESLTTAGSPTATAAAATAAATATAEGPAAAASAPVVKPVDRGQIAAVLGGTPVVLDASGSVKGGLDSLKGKRFYIAEYRLLFEQSGSIQANTRAAYLGGTSYGATRMTVRYATPPYDIAVLQAITDRAYADFVARLVAAGATPEPMEKISTEFGTVYETTVEASKPGAPVLEEASFGHGKRQYVVMAPTGMKLHPRGFAGLGAGNISNRIAYSKADVDAISVGMAVHIAAQESSGNASSLFRSGSTANASAGMEVTAGPAMMLLQSHAKTNLLRIETPLAVPGQFASFREVGGYDTRKDATMVGLTLLGNLAGRAVNQSKTVDISVDMEASAMAALALQGIVSIHQGIASQVK